MQVYSTINSSQSINADQSTNNLLTYQRMLDEYVKNGFTYKSNQILHKVAQKSPKNYPYDLLLQIAKVYHLNQFQIIFFTHILTQTLTPNSPCYDKESQIFNIEEHQFPSEVQELIKGIYEECQSYSSNYNEVLGEQLLETKKQYKNVEDEEEQDNVQEEMPHFTIQQLKKIYLYLLVIGYAIKYYLNEPTKVKPFEQYLKSILPNFFSNVFNKWARKFGNSVLSTTPRKINAYYMGLGFLQGQEQNNDQKQGDDCQYRNYNQIVEELIKATTQGDDQTGQLNGDDPSHNANE